MIPQHRIARRALAVTAMALAAACTAKGGRSDYKADGDTGMASPGTVLTPNPTLQPDSTMGVGARSGVPGMAGDTNSIKNKANATTNDNSKGAPVNRRP